MIGRAEPIAAPFPHIAGHVIQSVTIRFVGINGRRPDIPVAGVVFDRKFALPNIALVFSILLQQIAPWIGPVL